MTLSRLAVRRGLASIAALAVLGGCSMVDSAVFGGTDRVGALEDRKARTENVATSGDEDRLADIRDPNVFLRSAARIARNSDEPESAALHFLRLYENGQRDEEVVVGLGESLRKIGRTEDAERVLRQGLRDMRGKRGVEEELGKTLIAQGRLRDGVNLLQRLADTSDSKREKSRIGSAIGVAYDRAGDHEKARAAYSMALNADPLNAIALNNLGLSHALSGDLKNAEATLREALIAPNASLQVRQNLVMVLSLQGERQQAERLAMQGLPRHLAQRSVDFFDIGDRVPLKDASAE